MKLSEQELKKLRETCIKNPESGHYRNVLVLLAEISELNLTISTLSGQLRTVTEERDHALAELARDDNSMFKAVVTER